MLHLNFGYCWQAFLVNYTLHLQIAIAIYIKNDKNPSKNQNWYLTLLLGNVENEPWGFCLNTLTVLAK